MTRPIKVFSTRAGAKLGAAICSHLSIEPGEAEIRQYADNEIRVVLEEEARNHDVFIIAPTQPPGDNILEATFLVDAVRYASAARVTLVCPYLGYNRQDRKDRPRVTQSAARVIEILKQGIDRALLLDLHSEATAASFRPAIVDQLYASKVMLPELQQVIGGQEVVVVSPDSGGVPRAAKMRHFLGGQYDAVISKLRNGPNKVGEVRLVGDVSKKLALIVDDIVDTAGTITKNASLLMEAGATDVNVAATHGLLSGPAIERIDDSPISKLLLTDSIESVREKVAQFKNTEVTIVPIARLLASAVRKVHDGESISELIL